MSGHSGPRLGGALLEAHFQERPGPEGHPAGHVGRARSGGGLTGRARILAMSAWARATGGESEGTREP